MSSNSLEPTPAFFSIGDLSERTGCKVPTIRFYEQKGLLPEPRRSEGGQRRYTASGLQCLRFICHARQLGFSLAATSKLLALNAPDATEVEHADGLVADQIRVVKLKIKRLRSLQKELERMLASCDSDQHDCAVIEALANHELCDSDHE